MWKCCGGKTTLLQDPFAAEEMCELLRESLAQEQNYRPFMHLILLKIYTSFMLFFVTFFTTKSKGQEPEPHTGYYRCPPPRAGTA
jgi:hypothetical protein